MASIAGPYFGLMGDRLVTEAACDRRDPGYHLFRAARVNVVSKGTVSNSDRRILSERKIYTLSSDLDAIFSRGESPWDKIHP